jgi:hypothetical protein
MKAYAKQWPDRVRAIEELVAAISFHAAVTSWEPADQSGAAHHRPASRERVDIEGSQKSAWLSDGESAERYSSPFEDQDGTLLSKAPPAAKGSGAWRTL